MLDIKFIREEREVVEKALRDRFNKLDVNELVLLDEKRRDVLLKAEKLKSERNGLSKKIGLLIKDGEKTEELKEEVRGISQKIATLDKEVGELDEKIAIFTHNIPNIPHKSVPIGKDEKANEVIKEWGDVKQFAFTPQNHLNICEKLKLADFLRAARITGSNFPLFTGEGARLERALINFMLDLHHKKHGYLEIWPPSLVNRASMFGTGQLPKLEKDMYQLKDDGLFLIPTAEVPVTNMHRGEVIDADKLPMRYVAYTPCFRREAGSYGKETMGLIRVHQFDKVELVKIVMPQASYDELESILEDAEEVLRLLKIPYRVSVLSTGELSFAAAKCYDIEAWAPGANAYLEVSSCSNFEDFQARRMGIRFKDVKAKKKGFVHTLNGSGVALARTFICLIENYQQEDGSILIPDVLRPYMSGQKTIQPPSR